MDEIILIYYMYCMFSTVNDLKNISLQSTQTIHITCLPFKIFHSIQYVLLWFFFRISFTLINQKLNHYKVKVDPLHTINLYENSL